MVAQQSVPAVYCALKKGGWKFLALLDDALFHWIGDSFVPHSPVSCKLWITIIPCHIFHWRFCCMPKTWAETSICGSRKAPWVRLAYAMQGPFRNNVFMNNLIKIWSIMILSHKGYKNHFKTRAAWAKTGWLTLNCRWNYRYFLCFSGL